MTEDVAKSSSTRWDIARVLLGAGNILTAGFFMLVVGSLFAESTKSIAVLLIQIVLLVSLGAQFVAAFGLIRKRQWAGPTLLGAVAGQVVALGVAMVITKWSALLIPAIPALLTLGLLTFPKFGVPLGRGGKDLGLRPIHAGLIAGGLGLIYLISVEIDYVAKELKLVQHQSACEDTGEPFECRQAAMVALQLADDFDEMRKIEKRFIPLCEKGNGAACRSIGYARSHYFGHLGPSRSVIGDRLADVVPDACRNGDGRACAVAFWHPFDRDDVLLAKAKELCDGGDRNACLVGVRLAQERRSSSAPSPTEQFDAACKAGVTTLCETKHDARTRCLWGELEACAEAAKGDDAAALQALADVARDVGNPGVYGFVPPAGDHVAACNDGDSMSCLVAGLELLGPSTVPSSHMPVLPPPAELDATIGRACDEGIAVACLAYGFRVLDRGVGEDRDIERANKRLQQGCELGSEAACRHISFEAEIRKHDFDGYRDQLGRACAATGEVHDCKAYTSMLAFDLGATPWPFNEEIAYVHLRHACEHTKDAMACANAAYFLHKMDVTPEFQHTALSLGHVSCQQSYAEGCQTLFWSAERWWPTQLEGLKKKICPHVPAACR